MTNRQDDSGASRRGCAGVVIFGAAAVIGIAVLLLKYGMTLSMLWWESR